MLLPNDATEKDGGKQHEGRKEEREGGTGKNHKSYDYKNQ